MSKLSPDQLKQKENQVCLIIPKFKTIKTYRYLRGRNILWRGRIKAS